MTPFEIFCAGLTAEDDAPAMTPPPIPNWTENIWWIAYDPVTGIGVAAHLGSTRHDFNVIRQTIVVALPEGRLATDVSVGGLPNSYAPRTPRIARGATLVMECVDPFREWRVSSNGVAQIGKATDLWNNSPRQSQRVPLQLDLRGECLGPVWMAGAGDDVEHMQKQEWAKSHYQQTIRLRGAIELDGVRHEFNGTGYRDHSRGPRDFSSWSGHALFTAPFSSGRSFGLMALFGPGGATTYSSAYVVRDGILQRGKPGEVRRVSTDVLNGESGAFELVIGGRTERIHYRVHACSLLSMLAPYDVTPGLYRDRPGGIALCDAFGSFEWDGETGYGILERTVLTDTLPLI